MDEVRNYVESRSSSEANPSQQVLTAASQNLADLRDAQLFVTYVQLIQNLDRKEQGELFEEQRRWLDKRAETARATVMSEGGTLGRLEYSEAFGKLTEERLTELRERLRQRHNIIQKGKESEHR